MLFLFISRRSAAPYSSCKRLQIDSHSIDTQFLLFSLVVLVVVRLFPSFFSFLIYRPLHSHTLSVCRCSATRGLDQRYCFSSISFSYFPHLVYLRLSAERRGVYTAASNTAAATTRRLLGNAALLTQQENQKHTNIRTPTLKLTYTEAVQQHSKTYTQKKKKRNNNNTKKQTN